MVTALFCHVSMGPIQLSALGAPPWFTQHSTWDAWRVERVDLGEGPEVRSACSLWGGTNALSPSPVPFPSPHRKVPPFPTAQSPPPPLSFLQVVR